MSLERIPLKPKYERLTPIKYVEHRADGRYWLFKCDCGTEKIIRMCTVKQGKTKSCGCLSSELREAFGKKIKDKPVSIYSKVNPSFRKLIQNYEGMKARCFNKNHHSYKNYGDRGITVCLRWASSFENFYKDMGPRPSLKHSIDRIDVNGNYEPSNCRWADVSTQALNKRASYLFLNGERIKQIDLSKLTSTSMYTITKLARSGKSAEEIVEICKERKCL